MRSKRLFEANGHECRIEASPPHQGKFHARLLVLEKCSGKLLLSRPHVAAFLSQRRHVLQWAVELGEQYVANPS